MGYVFTQTRYPGEMNEADKKVVNHMCTMWTSFAKTGWVDRLHTNRKIFSWVDLEFKVCHTSELFCQYHNFCLCSFTFRRPKPSLQNLDWRPHTPERPAYLEIDNTLRIFDVKLRGERLSFWARWLRNFRYWILLIVVHLYHFIFR